MLKKACPRRQGAGLAEHHTWLLGIVNCIPLVKLTDVRSFWMKGQLLAAQNGLAVNKSDWF